MNGSPENRILPFRDKMDEDCLHCHAFLKCECSHCQTRPDGALTVGDFADCGCQEFVTVLCCQGVRDGEQCCNQRFFVNNVVALQKSIREAEKEDYDVSKIEGYKGCIHDAKRFNRVGCMETGCCMPSSGTSVTATTNENRGEIPLASRFGTCYTDLFADAGDDVLMDDADGDADSEADLSEEESEGSEEWSSASSDSPVSSPVQLVRQATTMCLLQKRHFLNLLETSSLWKIVKLFHSSLYHSMQIWWITIIPRLTHVMQVCMMSLIVTENTIMC